MLILRRHNHSLHLSPTWLHFSQQETLLQFLIWLELESQHAGKRSTSSWWKSDSLDQKSSRISLSWRLSDRRTERFPSYLQFDFLEGCGYLPQSRASPTRWLWERNEDFTVRFVATLDNRLERSVGNSNKISEGYYSRGKFTTSRLDYSHLLWLRVAHWYRCWIFRCHTFDEVQDPCFECPESQL